MCGFKEVFLSFYWFLCGNATFNNIFIYCLYCNVRFRNVTWFNKYLSLWGSVNQNSSVHNSFKSHNNPSYHIGQPMQKFSRPDGFRWNDIRERLSSEMKDFLSSCETSVSSWAQVRWSFDPQAGHHLYSRQPRGAFDLPIIPFKVKSS